MPQLKLGVILRARKDNEHRVPIHPAHFEKIPESIRRNIFFEQGYGEAFGVPDSDLSRRFGGLSTREDLCRECDIVLLPKPQREDLEELKEGGILWGWPHCVQQKETTQIAIDRRQTLIAWEAMFTWRPGGVRDMHLFYRNNEMAGYCGVAHMLSLEGVDGFYGPALRAIILSHGSVSRGAIHGLRSRGIEDVTVYTQRPPWSVHDKIIGCRYAQMIEGNDGVVTAIEEGGRRRPILEVLSEADLIVNGILQDTDHPLMFTREGEESALKAGALIIDISCNLRMGFPFARPTSFEHPTFKVGPATYYSVDHTPTYLWRSASWEISQVVVPFLPSIMGGPSAWDEDETIRRSIEIRNGVIQNEKILSFQNRATNYPHPDRQRAGVKSCV